ncbi:MAG: hypothetical protein ACLFR0_09240 [Alphaproteobacteria bacterium]
MFSIIGQYILPPKREAEKSDTNQFIRRKDQDHGNKRHKKRSSDDIFDSEDKASVSVDALYSFLENVIADENEDITRLSYESNKDKKNRDILEEAALITMRRQIDTSKNSKAASAYAHAAETSPRAEIRRNAYSNKEGDFDGIISDEDKDAIRALLTTLKKLQTRNIRTIEIARAESFIQSLQNAVQAYQE